MPVLLFMKMDLELDKVDKLFTQKGAEKLSALPGLQWKIWGIDREKAEGCGVYLYATRRDAEIRAAKAVPELAARDGICNITTQIFEIEEDLTKITKAPINLPANPSYPQE